MLEIKNLNKSFKVSNLRSSLILENVNFTFPNKGLYFVLGKSGSGKSTLLNILSGLMPADSGEVLFNNKNILKFSKKELNNYLRNDISILFQKYNLIDDMSVIDNLLVAESVKNVNSMHLIDDLLQKYKLESKKNQIVNSLSGGEKQRVALIRALVSRPKILFCDEPTGALDEENSIKLIKLLKEASKETLVIVVTHNLALFDMHHDGYLKLVNGKIADKEGSIKDIPEENESIKRKSNSKFINLIANKNVGKNFSRNLINTISTVFSIMVLLISMFFKIGINSNKENLIDSYVNKNAFSISLNRSEEIENSPIQLSKNERPSYEQVYTLVSGNNCIIHYSYDYFFEDKKYLNVNNSKLENFEARPFYDPNIEINSLIVNKQFSELVEGDLVGKEANLTLKTSFSYISEKNNLTITENFEKEIPFIITKVGDEFSYMNQPTIYYSTFYFEKILEETIAINSSIDRDENISFYDLLVGTRNDSELSAYEMNVFCSNKKEQSLLQKLIDNGSSESLIFSVNNFGYSMVNSFLSMSNSIFIGMNLFIGLSIITSLFITGFLAYSSALLNRKESAILSSLGARDDDVLSIYLVEQMIYTIVGIVIGAVLSYFAIGFLNQSLSNFFVNKKLISFDYISTLTTCIVGLLLAFLTNYITLKAIKMRKISEELKEE